MPSVANTGTAAAPGQRESLAIVGIGCRFAGTVDSPEALWQLLCGQGVAFVDVPPERWSLAMHHDSDPDAPGKTVVRQGGFLAQPIDRFDAAFFGILPREAESLDPQQRLLLECSWEALEDAGIPAEDLAGSPTGVYVGAFTLDGMVNQVSPLSRHLISPNTATGISATMLSNRLSYFYDLRGPSFSTDTACSSSLVAFHYACQDLWNGRISMALVGGANVMLRPEYPIAMSKGGFLSPDARCKPFDERANGYARGEGAAIVALKPLSAAIADGNPIYALVAGTGVNQDGRTVGITVPNFESQKALIEDVYRRYELDPADTVYVEAHGTGTPVGDPIEARAIGEAVGQTKNPRSQPLLMGSLKANIGHTEAVAGVAGIIKAALCLDRKFVPPQANLLTANPEIPFQDLCLKLPRDMEALPRHHKPIQAGINSFGYGGTNAHAVLMEGPATKPVDADRLHDGRSFLTPLSARSTESLQQFAQACAEQLSDPSVSMDGFRRALAFRRTHHGMRLAVIADSRSELVEKLRAVGAGEMTVPGIVQGRAQRGTMEKPVFVFTGMGPQWWGMGRELMANEPVFRAKAEKIDAIFQRITGWSILEEMARDEEQSRITVNKYAQPANFVIQVALAALWRSWGIEPAAIVGHSVGEVSAAYVAGVLSLEDATLVSYCRSHAQQAAAGKGRMLAVGMGADDVRELLLPFAGRVEIAAINSPSSCTLAGDPDAIEEISADLAKKTFNRILTVEVAYHSHHMEPLENDIRASLASITPQLPTVPLYSTVTGKIVKTAIHNADYWWRNVRKPVRFADAIAALAADGHGLYLEVGPHPVLKAAIDGCLAEAQLQGSVLKSLERKKPERATMLQTVGRLYAMGTPVDWLRFIPAGKGYVRFPRYPWHREKHWLESEDNRTDRIGWQGHPMLGRRLPLPTPTWETEINKALMPWVDDHVIDGAKLLPGAGYLEAALEAGRQLWGGRAGAVENVRLLKALAVPPKSVVRLRLQADPVRRSFTIHSRSMREGSEWALHADGSLSTSTGSTTATSLDIPALCSRLGNGEDGQVFYHRLAERGLTYGPRFQGVKQLWSGPNEVLARLELHADIDPDDGGYGLHPTLLDASFQMMIGALDSSEGVEGAYVPVHLGRVAMLGEVGRAAWAHGQVTLASRQFIEGDIILTDDSGIVVARIDGLRCQSVGAASDVVRQHMKSWLYEYQWELLEDALDGSSWDSFGSWLVLADREGYGEGLASMLMGRNQPCLLAHAQTAAAGLTETADGLFQLRPDVKGDMVDLLKAAKSKGVTSVLYCWGGDDDPDDLDGTRRCIALMHMVQAMRDTEMLPRLVVVTRGSQAVAEGDRPSPGQAAVWGLARVILNEIPEIRCRSIDLPSDAVLSAAVIDAIMAETEEDELAIRGGTVHVHRLTRVDVPDDDAFVSQPQPASGTAFAVEAGNGARLRGLPLRAPGQGEALVRMHSVAVNHADAQALAGRLPADAANAGFFGDSVGIEACGVVEDVGPDAGALAAGDVVVPLVAGGLVRSHVTLPIAALEPVPASLGDTARRCAIGVQSLSFVIGLLAVRNVGKVKPGETVFVPVTGRGWEMAAIQWIHHLGGNVIASVDNEDMRQTLNALAVSTISGSLPAELADQVLHVTGGRGVDAVITSLEGEAFERCLQMLIPFGRVVRVVERGTSWSEAVPSRLLVANATLTVLDIDRIFASRMETVRAAISQVWEGFAKGWLGLIPTVHAAIGEVASVFDRLLPDNYSPRIQIALGEGDVQVLPEEVSRQPFRRDGTYLVTGGFGGFGAEFARWMADQGAGHLVLIGRNGAATPEAQALLADIEKRGASAVGRACDVSSRQAVANLLQDVRKALPPIRGVIHAATVFDDRFVLGMDADGFRNVMGPKAMGALHLDEETRCDPIEVFLNFSSVSALIGKPGQCNYVSANSVLDTLARRRQADGLPCLSINWGVIGEVGVAARDDDLREHLARQGIRAMPYRQAIDLVPHLIHMNAVQVGLMDVDWEANLGFLPSPRLSRLMGGPDETITPYVQMVQDSPPNERAAMVQSMLLKEVAESLRLPVDKIEADVPLSNLGVDSLAAVELQTAIRTAFGVNLSQLEIVTGDGVAHIAALILSRLKFGAVKIEPTEAVPVEQMA